MGFSVSGDIRKEGPGFHVGAGIAAWTSERKGQEFMLVLVVQHGHQKVKAQGFMSVLVLQHEGREREWQSISLACLEIVMEKKLQLQLGGA